MVFPFAFWTDYSAVEVFNRISPPFATGAWAETYSMSPITGQPVLIAFNAADYAWQLETLGAEETKAKFMAVLRSLFGPLIPQPVSVSRPGCAQPAAYTRRPACALFIPLYSFTAAPLRPPPAHSLW